MSFDVFALLFFFLKKHSVMFVPCFSELACEREAKLSGVVVLFNALGLMFFPVVSYLLASLKVSFKVQCV